LLRKKTPFNKTAPLLRGCFVNTICNTSGYASSNGDDNDGDGDNNHRPQSLPLLQPAH